MKSEPKSINGYQYAVLSVERAEGNESVGTQWQDTHLVPLGMSLRDAVKHIFGETLNWPKGRVTITIPETLPFDPPPS